jgi:YHS domain-containing protein
MQDRPTAVIDPVCGMTVDVARAEAAGLTTEHDGRTYAFCRSGCLRAFGEEPDVHAAKAEAAAAAAVTATAASDGPERALPVIDEGMRRWYESCACCLGDTYPEIKATLDAERAAAAQPPVDPGICEVADAATT